jgi:hypothetical protein
MEIGEIQGKTPFGLIVADTKVIGNGGFRIKIRITSGNHGHPANLPLCIAGKLGRAWRHKSFTNGGVQADSLIKVVIETGSGTESGKAFGVRCKVGFVGSCLALHIKGVIATTGRGREPFTHEFPDCFQVTGPVLPAFVG